MALTTINVFDYITKRLIEVKWDFSDNPSYEEEQGACYKTRRNYFEARNKEVMGLDERNGSDKTALITRKVRSE